MNLTFHQYLNNVIFLLILKLHQYQIPNGVNLQQIMVLQIVVVVAFVVVMMIQFHLIFVCIFYVFRFDHYYYFHFFYFPILLMQQMANLQIIFFLFFLIEILVFRHYLFQLNMYDPFDMMLIEIIVLKYYLFPYLIQLNKMEEKEDNFLTLPLQLLPLSHYLVLFQFFLPDRHLLYLHLALMMLFVVELMVVVVMEEVILIQKILKLHPNCYHHHH